ncbi:MAG: IS110 family transposase, partial [Synergistaceae bacterium]|nr:IS110 family transposase [Synergistaceae bacterium]
MCELMYMGIDIGKKHHEAGIVAADGRRMGKSLRFSNTKEGFERLLSFVEWRLSGEEELVTGMEATGHYWLALYSFLCERGFSVRVINPIQTDGFRNFHIRGTKTDSVDSFLIAEAIRFGNFESTRLAEEDIVSLKNLTRLRESFRDMCSDLKRKAVAVMDQVFPEYESVFPDMFCLSSRTALKECAVPAKIKEMDLNVLTGLVEEASRGRLGEERARRIKEAAASSIGVKISADTLALEMRLLLESMEDFEKRIAVIDGKIAEIMAGLGTEIATVPGVSPVTGAVMLAEIGDIDRFDSPKKLVAYAGLDPQLKQSGAFEGNRTRISKRGSPSLRRAFWMSAVVAAQTDPVFKALYEKKRREGKAYGTAIGA